MCKQHCSAERSCDHTTRLRDCLHSTACSTCENELHVFRAQQRLLLLDHVALWLSQDFVKVVGTAGTVRRWGSNAAFIWAGQRKSGSPLQLPSLQHSTAQHSTAQHSSRRPLTHVRPLSSTLMGSRPCSSASMSDGLQEWKAPLQMKRM